MAHGIFRSDNCSYTRDGAKIRTIKTYAQIDNGAPIKLGALVTGANVKYSGEAEVFSTATANGAAAADVFVVTTLQEVKIDENVKLIGNSEIVFEGKFK